MTTAIDLGAHQQHRLHQDDSAWSNSNCYVDVWLELLPLYGLNPAPALACAFGAEFIGDQWEFLKISATDLRELYGLKVGEYDTWRPLLDHVQLQLDLRNVCLIEVDAYFLPDTAGVSYRSGHTKTTIAPLALNREEKTVRYLHNDSLFTLNGADFDGIFGPEAEHGLVPRPYVELVRTQQLKHDDEATLRQTAAKLLRGYLDAAPAQNQVAALNRHITASLPELASGGMELFHGFTFATTRQLGITAMFAAEFCRWFDGASEEPAAVASESFAVAEVSPQSPLSRAEQAFDAVSLGAKSLQFKLARAAAGRTINVAELMTSLEEQWALGLDAVREHLGSLGG